MKKKKDIQKRSRPNVYSEWFRLDERIVNCLHFYWKCDVLIFYMEVEQLELKPTLQYGMLMLKQWFNLQQHTSPCYIFPFFLIF